MNLVRNRGIIFLAPDNMLTIPREHQIDNDEIVTVAQPTSYRNAIHPFNHAGRYEVKS